MQIYLIDIQRLTHTDTIPNVTYFLTYGTSFPYSSRKWYGCFPLENEIHFHTKSLNLQEDANALI